MDDAGLYLLRVYTDVAATRDGEPYWKVLIDRARSMALANAAVLQVLDAFGRAAIVHNARAIDLEPGRHVIVELTGAQSALEAFHATLEQSDDTGLVTLEHVGIVGYGGHRHHVGPA
jgi:PII-like signaling protein